MPFQLEKYLATYLPTAIPGFYFSCHLIRNPCYFYCVLSCSPVLGVHMQTLLFTAASECTILCLSVCVCIFLFFSLQFLFLSASFFHKGKTAHSCDLVWEGREGVINPLPLHLLPPILHEKIRTVVHVCVDVILS